MPSGEHLGERDVQVSAQKSAHGCEYKGEGTPQDGFRGDARGGSRRVQRGRAGRVQMDAPWCTNPRTVSADHDSAPVCSAAREAGSAS
jgi:hypothetical protein